jgi:hypothetical protein
MPCLVVAQAVAIVAQEVAWVRRTTWFAMRTCESDSNHSPVAAAAAAAAVLLLLLLCRYTLVVSLMHTAAQQTHLWMKMHAGPQTRQPQTLSTPCNT